MLNFLLFIFIGAFAGFLAAKIFKGKSSGFVVNLVVGIIGSIVGGWIFKALDIFTDGGSFMISLITSTVGAILFLWILSIFKRR